MKDEGRLPTGSFKARGLCLAVSMARELGLSRVAMPTNGNAGAALAAYASRAGIEAYVFCPEDTPDINVREIAAQGAHVWRVNGLINDCGKIVGQGQAAMNWFDFSTLKEPYRIEGKKTMGLELAEQCGWRLPRVILYPTGGGTGLIGMWKAFQELKAIGWIQDPLPRMIAVQADGCAPIVRAFEAGAKHADLWENAHTVAAGIRVPVAIGDFLILRACAKVVDSRQPSVTTRSCPLVKKPPSRKVCCFARKVPPRWQPIAWNSRRAGLPPMKPPCCSIAHRAEVRLASRDSQTGLP